MKKIFFLKIDVNAPQFRLYHCSDKDRLERIRQENDMKLAELKEKQSDLEATIKSHTHEKDLFVDANTNYRQQIETIDDQRTQLTQEKRKYHT